MCAFYSPGKKGLWKRNSKLLFLCKFYVTSKTVPVHKGLIYQTLSKNHHSFFFGLGDCTIIWCAKMTLIFSLQITKTNITMSTLQMFTGNCRDSAGKSECRDFKFMGIARIPAIPVIKKSPHSVFHVKIVGILTLQGYYGDTPH